MRYEVTGGNKQKREVVDTAMSYVIHLIKIPSNVYIEIVFIKSGSHGIMQYSKGRFLMEINTRVGLTEIAYTVFHEMKHVEQMTSGKLLHTHDKTLWLGEDHTDTPYRDCPWEVEAYKFEKSADLMLTYLAA